MVETTENSQVTRFIFPQKNKMIEESLRTIIEKNIYGILPFCKEEDLIIPDREKKKRFVTLLQEAEGRISASIFDLYIPKLLMEVKNSNFKESIMGIAFFRNHLLL